MLNRRAGRSILTGRAVCGPERTRQLRIVYRTALSRKLGFHLARDPCSVGLALLHPPSAPADTDGMRSMVLRPVGGAELGGVLETWSRTGDTDAIYALCEQVASTNVAVLESALLSLLELDDHRLASTLDTIGAAIGRSRRCQKARPLSATFVAMSAAGEPAAPAVSRPRDGIGIPALSD